MDSFPLLRDVQHELFNSLGSVLHIVPYIFNWRQVWTAGLSGTHTLLQGTHMQNVPGCL